MWSHVEFFVRAFSIMSTECNAGVCGSSADVGPHGDHERHGQTNGHGNCEPHQLCSSCALTVPIVDHGVLQMLIKQTGTDESIGGIAGFASGFAQQEV